MEEEEVAAGVAQPLTEGVEKPDTVDKETVGADKVADDEVEEDAIVIQRGKTRGTENRESQSRPTQFTRVFSAKECQKRQRQ